MRIPRKRRAFRIINRQSTDGRGNELFEHKEKATVMLVSYKNNKTVLLDCVVQYRRIISTGFEIN